MPEWMLIKAKKAANNPEVDSYFGKSKDKPTRSVYSFMDTRHKVMTKEDAEKSNANDLGGGNAW